MIIKSQEQKKVYSDGNEVESLMLQIAKDYPEDESQEFISDSSKYTVNNTFSSVRQNILNWYPFKDDCSILEVGAGMGSITGMLCDKASHVTAIEMSEARAEVIKARYPGRKNLTVISEDITTWKTNEKFDYVVFIGVLEYAEVFVKREKPFEYFLQCAKDRLKRDGILLFAIENRFGLKYWVGGSEDHLQIPYKGIKGYVEPNTPKTFSRADIEGMLDEVGFNSKRVYSVYPDYKFPEVICSDEYSPSYMNLQKVNFTYSLNSELVLNEKNIYKDLIENDVWRFFANSFLIEAGNKEISNPHVIHVSAKGEVKKEYRVSTVIYSDGIVKKIPMHKFALKHNENILTNNENLEKKGVTVLKLRKNDQGILISDFETKMSAQSVFTEALRNNDEKTLFHLIQLLKESLLKSSEITYENSLLNDIDNIDRSINYGPILKDGYIDMTFYNAFFENDDLVFFDQEWRFENVPLLFILYYAVKSSFFRAQVKTGISFEQVIAYAGVNPNQIETFDRVEEYLWSKVLYRQTDFYGEDGYCRRYHEELTKDYINKKKEFEVQNIISEIEDKNVYIAEMEAELSDRNVHIAEMEAKLNDMDACIREKEAELDNERVYIREKEKLLDEKNNQIKKLESVTSNLNQEILNKNGHIEQLLVQERYLMNIKNSKGGRLLQKWWDFKDWVLPHNSKRRAIAKILKKFIKHPIYMLKKCTPSRIKRTLHYINTEDGAQIENRLEAATINAGEKRDIERYKLDLLPVNENIISLDDLEVIELPKVDHPVVSIIIPVYNQFHYTYNCLKSIANHTVEKNYEVILADDCSTDFTKDIEKIVKNLIVSKTPENMRFLKNCNLAASKAKGKYLFFLNNDTQVLDGWLTNLLEIMERDEEVGIVGSKLLYPDGSLQEAGGILWKDGSAWNYGNQSAPMDSEFDYVREVDYISGAAILVRKTIWDEIGGFDERFAPAYCEDSDLAFEVRKHGYKVIYQPTSMVVHFEGISNGRDTSSGQKEYQIINSKKFYEKWKNELKNNHFPNGEEVFLARERSRNHKHILVIDHYVPQYDKDAGSKTTFMYLKMLVEKGYKITFWGDNFYRHEPYTSELQQMGIFVLYGPKFANNWKKWLDDNLKYFDVVYMNRPHISIKYIDYIKERANGKIIYYGHDLHFLRMQREAELTNNTKLLEESEEWKEKELYLMSKADMSYYPSSIECDAIHKIDSEIAVKPITAYVYDSFRDVKYDYKMRNGLLFVGGFGHGPNLDAVLWFLNNIYPKVYENTKAPFYIVGSKAPKEITEIKTEGVIVKGFVSEEELQQLYDMCRMVIVPLRYGAGVKGKVVEALYYGTPIVTTSVGAEGIEGIENIVEIDDSENDLIEAISSIYNNPEKLLSMSESSQRYVRKMFSTEAVWKIIEEDFV